MEEAGLPTVTLALLKEHAARVKPPRALFVPFPYGYALGRPNDPAFQHRVIAAALALFDQPAGPVLAEFPEDGDGPARLVQASQVQAATPVTTDAADELTAARRYYERWVEAHDGRTQVGATGIPQRRFRGLVRFLQQYLADEAADFAERPADVPLPVFIRRAADDLKAFMMEARMEQRPADTDNPLYTWFWGETATGALVKALADKFKTAGDERTAFGIAR